MAIELASKFAPYVDEQFKQESKTSVIATAPFDFAGANVVNVYTVTTAPMNDYNRTGEVGENMISRYGSPDNLTASTVPYQLKRDRSFTFTIDKLDQDETVNQLEAGSALARQVREVVIPEVDSYTIGKIADNAGIKAEPFDSAEDGKTFYELLSTATAALDDAEVPESDRVLIVSPTMYQTMKLCDQIVMETETGNDMRLKGVIAHVDGAAVIKVPASRLPEGFGFLLFHPSAVAAPKKLEDYRTHINPPGISGMLVEGRIVYDAFVLHNKAKGVYYQPVTTE